MRSYWELTLGVSCMLVTLFLQWLKRVGDRRGSRALQVFATTRNSLVVVIAAVVTYYVNRAHPGVIPTIGKMPGGVPRPAAPTFNATLAADLAVAAIPLALVGFLEAIAIARAFGRRHGYKVDTSQELVAVGVTNLVGSFFGGYPVTGSFSRSAVQAQSGVKSLLAGLVTSSIVLLSLGVATKVLVYIPQAALSAIIIVAIVQIFNFRIVIDMWRLSKFDLIPWAVSFVGSTFSTARFVCVTFNQNKKKRHSLTSITRHEISVGVGSAVLVNALVIMYFSARPGLTDLSRDPGISLHSDHSIKIIRENDESQGYSPSNEMDPTTPLLSVNNQSGEFPQILESYSRVLIMRIGGRYMWAVSVVMSFAWCCFLNEMPIVCVLFRRILYTNACHVKDALLQKSRDSQAQLLIIDCSVSTWIDFSGILVGLVLEFDARRVGGIGGKVVGKF